MGLWHIFSKGGLLANKCPFGGHWLESLRATGLDYDHVYGFDALLFTLLLTVNRSEKAPPCVVCLKRN